MELARLIRPELVFAKLPGSDRVSVLRAVAERMAAEGVVGDPEELYRKLWEREELGSTGIGSAVAVPHCKLPGLAGVVVSVAICSQEIDFESRDGVPVRLLFTVISPEDEPAAHLQSLAAISKWVKADHHVERILSLADPEAICSLFREEGGGR